jgi:GNAT superfamily N-acetyltransferase
MNEVRYDLRLPTTSELAELTRLYASTFGEQAATQWRARWEWQFARGPAADRSDYCVASLNGAAVGQYALMPVTLWWSDREARAAFGTDAFLAPTVRGRGAGKQLYDTANHAGFDVCLGAGITIDSLRVLQRLEWTDMKTIPMLARRTSWRRHLSLAGLRQLVSRSRTKPGARDVDVHIAKTSAIGTEFDELWRACRSGFALCVRRDAAYLRWRYQDVP